MTDALEASRHRTVLDWMQSVTRKSGLPDLRWLPFSPKAAARRHLSAHTVSASDGAQAFADDTEEAIRPFDAKPAVCPLGRLMRSIWRFACTG
jgi:hypothetical protein